DFNTAQALAVLFDLSRDINRLRTQEGYPNEALAPVQKKMMGLGAVLGLKLEAPAESAAEKAADPFVQLLVELRGKLRSAKQWALADEVRDRLKELGVAIEDRPEGTIWKYSDRT
ncbi:MAG TPA: DALR domain-containing protein, partial [Chloroflexota bacterium]|nr:DALR domain-containing protein [Chloroflexota bacterium]